MNSDQQTSMQSTTLEQDIAATMHQDATDALIAQAVRSAALPLLPVDFAAQVAAALASKTDDTSSELAIAVGLLVLLALSGLWYAGIYVPENFGTAIRSNLPLVFTLLAILALVQGWEVVKRLAGHGGRAHLI